MLLFMCSIRVFLGALTCTVQQRALARTAASLWATSVVLLVTVRWNLGWLVRPGRLARVVQTLLPMLMTQELTPALHSIALLALTRATCRGWPLGSRPSSAAVPRALRVLQVVVQLR